MPIRKVKGGYKWGKHGHVYKSRRGAEAQARAAYANGYRGDAADAPRGRLRAARQRRRGAPAGTPQGAVESQHATNSDSELPE